MTIDQLHANIRIIEGKLYAWAGAKIAYPGAPVSSVYEALQEYGTSQPAHVDGDKPSPQERWAMQHADQLRDASVIEHTLRRLAKIERNMVWARYGDGMAWGSVADVIHVSEQEVYRMRQRVLHVFAYEFGLLVGVEAS